MTDQNDIDLPDRNNITLEVVRGLGLDVSMVGGRAPIEKVFFLGPTLIGGRAIGAHATQAAVEEFIEHLKHQIVLSQEYLANGRNNKTHEWTRKPLAK